MVIKLKLFRVTSWFDYKQKADTFENFVIAENEMAARRIVEQEVWSLSGMGIKNTEEIDMSLPQLLCFINTKDIE